MSENTQDDDMLGTFFDAARRAGQVEPSADLMARVLADAERMQPDPAPVAGPAPRGGVWAGLIRSLGGWPAMAGLATATVAGVWIGIGAGSALVQDGVGATVAGALQTDSVLSDLDMNYAYLME